MSIPTEAELREVDEKLIEAGYRAYTRNDLRHSDSEYHKTHVSFSDAIENKSSLTDNESPDVSIEELAKTTKLTDRQREAIRWRLEGKSLRAIGKKLDCTYETARVDIDLACDIMRECAERYKWYGLLPILRRLDTRRSNWPDPDIQ